MLDADMSMTNGCSSPQMRHGEVMAQPFSESSQHEQETKPHLELPEGIFGLAGDLTRWELRNDSFHRPRPFNFNNQSAVTTNHQTYSD